MGIERNFKKKEKMKYMKIGGGIVITILLILVLYINIDKVQDIVPEEWFAFEASGTIQHHTDFYSKGVLINPETKDQFFYFINQYPSISLFTKTYESPTIISYTEGSHLTAGTGCGWGELIRFTYCDSATDKNSCNSDVFTHLWQVHDSGNYPDLYNYHTSENTFYFSYSCYNSNYVSYGELATELRWLDGDKCVNTASSTSTSVEYDSTKECLEALDNLPTDEVYNCYLCEDGFTAYKQVTQPEGWSCSAVNGVLYTTTENQCKSLHPEYFNTDPQDQQYTCFKCESGDLGAVILTQPEGWSCRQLSGTLYTTTLAQCQSAHPEYFNTDPQDQQYTCFKCVDGDTKIVSLTQPQGWSCTTLNGVLYTGTQAQCESAHPEFFDGGGDSGGSCSAYESVVDGSCSFSFSKIVTTQGITEYWNDHPVKLSIFAFFILVIGWLVYDTYFKKKKGGKK